MFSTIDKSEFMYDNIDIIEQFIKSSTFRKLFIDELSEHLNTDVKLHHNDENNTVMEYYTVYKTINNHAVYILTINENRILNYLNGDFDLHLFCKILLRNQKIEKLLN